jgi:hypothetical protein
VLGSPIINSREEECILTVIKAAVSNEKLGNTANVWKQQDFLHEVASPMHKTGRIGNLAGHVMHA